MGGYPRRLLGEDETVVHELHPHWKALVLPLLLVPVVVGLTSFGLAAMPDGRFQGDARWGLFGLGVLVLLVWTLVPYLRWRASLYVLTNRRLITRSGVLSRSGRDMPLWRVNDVHFEHNVFERMLGCGTLVVESGGERGQLVLGDVPAVEQVQTELYRLVEAESARQRGEMSS